MGVAKAISSNEVGVIVDLVIPFLGSGLDEVKLNTRNQSLIELEWKRGGEPWCGDLLIGIHEPGGARSRGD